MIKKCGLLLFLFSLSTVSVFGAQTVSGEGVTVTALPAFISRSSFGYQYYPVLVINHSSSKKKIEISIQANYSSELELVHKTFIIPAGETRTEEIMFPVLDLYAAGLKVQVDGVAINAIGKNIRAYRDYYSRGQCLVDSQISRNDFTRVFSSPFSRGSRDELESNYYEGGYDQFAKNWMAYSQYDALIFYANSLDKMPLSAREGIFNYVRAGGSLLVLGNLKVPSDFKKYRHSNQINPQIIRYSGGFGRLLVTDDNFLESVATDSFDPLADLCPGVISTLAAGSGSSPDFSDKEMESVSIKWLMILIYAFAFLIGPVNVYILHKIKKKIWVFATVPIASAICCLMIFGYYLIFESSLLIIKKRAVTLLDERENRAVTLGNFALFSSSTRSEGVKFDFDTEVVPVLHRRQYRREPGHTIYLHDKQHFRDGWVRARIPKYFHLRRIQTRRERITLQEKAGRTEIVNGLGADISEMLLLTRQGKLLEAKNIAAGARGELNEAGAIRQGMNKTDLSDFFSSNWEEEYKHLRSTPIRYIEPGMYVAKLKGSPFLDQQDFTGAERHEESVVIGVMQYGEAK